MTSFLVQPVQQMMSILTEKVSKDDVTSFLLSSLFFLLCYTIIERTTETTKSRSWIIMLLGSSVLSPVGAFYAFQTMWYGKWTSEFIYSDDFLSRQIMIYFVASNVMDLVIGSIRYPAFIDPFTTTCHHIFYIAFALSIISSNYSVGFMLCFFMEVPTLIMALGTVWPYLRSDYLFGVVFFLTRILFNAFQAYKLFQIHPNGWIWKVCTMVLCLHLHWFRQWWDKYGSYYNFGYNILQAEVSTTLQTKDKETQ